MRINLPDTNVAIKRSQDISVDSLFGYTANDIENISEIEVIDDGDVSAAIGDYRIFLEKEIRFDRVKGECDTKIVLSPSQIEMFLQKTSKFHQHKNYSKHTGSFLSSLIQNSYNEGHNDFYFNLHNQPLISRLGRNICARDNNPLNLYVDGNLGNSVMTDSKYIDVVIKGNVGEFFSSSSENNNVWIKGNVENDFMIYSFNSKAIIKGDVGSLFGWCSTDMIAAIDGDGSDSFAHGSSTMNAYVSGKIEQISSMKYDLSLKCGQDAQTNQTYISMMQDFERRMKR